ncbi:MAG: Mobile element protein [Nocardioides sp.]|jgi:transposase InsO family protein|nr:Mobile element protein [Nocardioides sp.]
MPHANARLNPRGRLLLIERVIDQHWPVAHAAKAMGISRQCAHRWINRYREAGPDGGVDVLRDRSSRPHHMPHQTPPEVEEKVLTLRREKRRGQDWIGAELDVAPRTVSRILRRNDVPYLAECDPMTGEVIRASKTTAVRYERERPGELVHVDVKKVGRIPDGGGWRALGRAATSEHRHKKTKIGYDYIHSMVDDHSRLAYSEAHDDEKGATCAGFLIRAAAYFATHGVAIERVLSDNHFSYRKSADFIEAVAAIGARQKFIKPHCPWQNGKVERYNRTLAAEWAYVRAYATNQDRLDALAPWIEHYNTQRRHTALGGQPPTSRLS